MNRKLASPAGTYAVHESAAQGAAFARSHIAVINLSQQRGSFALDAMRGTDQTTSGPNLITQ
jgi:hypothetical protein